MKVPPVKGYGDSAESFEDYYGRWPSRFGNFPKCVVENWVHRHWGEFDSRWRDKSPELFEFELVELNNDQVMQVGHIGNWMKELDYWGDELFRNRIRQSTWLAKYMLSEGTTPSPIIVAPNASGLTHPKGGPMHPNQLIEGHMRLAYLRGMIRHQYAELKPMHSVWHVSLPASSFKLLPSGPNAGP
ncbi:hypothetical protein [Stenotrophomonas terrae]|uniref:hypothetical protein n=1 Tax=Stenotrophomonas terrae TaxID=405446 RepID=UPI000709DF20|nr:hypothetical protein [Stenotrophomonas terrae]